MKRVLIILSLSIPGFLMAQGINKVSYDELGHMNSALYGTDAANYTFTQYYSSGIKSATGKFKDGKKQGTWKTWDENGQLMAIAHYKNGEKTGTWIINEPDHTSFEISFNHNHMLRAFKKDDHGHIVATR
jgi:antitoxin component YwqK of YwqJK toxin-antitoxin module